MKRIFKILVLIYIALVISCENDSSDGVEIEDEESSDTVSEVKTENNEPKSKIETKEMGKQVDNIIKPLINKLKEVKSLFGFNKNLF